MILNEAKILKTLVIDKQYIFKSKDSKELLDLSVDKVGQFDDKKLKDHIKKSEVLFKVHDD